jgi:hypothetical protein
MAPSEIFFNLFVAAAFCAAIGDHWFVGRGYIVVPLRAFMLGCFVYTESYLAVHAQPAMWFYVALNIWGLVNLHLGRKAPLRTTKRSSGNGIRVGGPTSTEKEPASCGSCSDE